MSSAKDNGPVHSWCTDCKLSLTPDEYQRHQKEVHVFKTALPPNRQPLQTSVLTPTPHVLVPSPGPAPELTTDAKAAAMEDKCSDSMDVVDMDIEEDESGASEPLLTPSANSMACTTCKLTFLTHVEYTTHMQNSHFITPAAPAVQLILPVDQYFPCPLCHGRVLRQELEHHMSLHTLPAVPALLSFTCSSCDRRFSDEKDVEEHSRLTHRPERRKSPAAAADRRRSRSPVRSSSRRDRRSSDRSSLRRSSRSPARRHRSHSRSPTHGSRDERRSRRSPSDRSGSSSYRRRDRSSRDRSRDRSPARRHRDRSPSHRSGHQSHGSRYDHRSSRRNRSRDRSPGSRHDHRSKSPDHLSTPTVRNCPLCPQTFCQIVTLLHHLSAKHNDAINKVSLPVERMLDSLHQTRDARRRLQEIEKEITDKLPVSRNMCPDAENQISDPRSRTRVHTEAHTVTDSRSEPAVHMEAAVLLPDQSGNRVSVQDTSFMQVGVVMGRPMADKFDVSENVATGANQADVSPKFSAKKRHVPQVPGDCELCGCRMFDLITHYFSFHGKKLDFEIAVQEHLNTGNILFSNSPATN